MARDDDALRRAVSAYDNALEKYIPVLMQQDLLTPRELRAGEKDLPGPHWLECVKAAVRRSPTQVLTRDTCDQRKK